MAGEWLTADVAVGSVVARLEQINREQEPGHWLWDRVMTCDVPRLRALLPADLVATLDEFSSPAAPRPPADCARCSLCGALLLVVSGDLRLCERCEVVSVGLWPVES